MFYKTVLQQRLILSASILQITSNFRMTALFELYTVHFETVMVGSYLRHSVHSTFHGNKSYPVSTQQHEWLHTTSQLFPQHIPRTVRHSESYVIYFCGAKKKIERNSSAARVYLVYIFENQHFKLQVHPGFRRVQ
jgi:hypothetical protein